MTSTLELCRYRGCISMFADNLCPSVCKKILHTCDSNDDFDLFLGFLYIDGKLSYFFSYHFTIMVDKVVAPHAKVNKYMEDVSKPHANKVQPKMEYFNFQAKNNHVLQCVDNVPGICESSKRETVLPKEMNRKEKSQRDPSLWQRRDSFSSCSSDSAVYCSSQHTQGDTIAQDVLKRKLVAATNGKKRQRHSSGSSALSSASDSSNKGASLHVNDLLDCLEHEACADTNFSNLGESITTKSTVSKQSMSHYPNTIMSQSEISTIVEEKTLSYSCKTFEKSGENERHHNLRRQIRKKTCHNCDCSGSHTTVVVRRYTQIQTATTTMHSPSKLRTVRQNSAVHPDCAPPKAQAPVEKACPSPEASASKSVAQKRRRSEIDKLYDALHEIEWAKHMSPDNILSQIDLRRAATESFYSSKNRSSTSELNSEKMFKSPQTEEGNDLIKDISAREEHVPATDSSCEPVGQSETDATAKRRLKNCQSNEKGIKSPSRMFLRSKNKGKKAPRNGFHLTESKKPVSFNKAESFSEKDELLLKQSHAYCNDISADTESVDIVKSRDIEAIYRPLKNDCDEMLHKFEVENVASTVPESSELSFIAISNNIHSESSVKEMKPNSNINMEIMANAANVPLLVHEQTNECFLLPVEPPCIEGDVVITCLDPYIVDIETTDCYEEVISDRGSEAVSPSLPRLTKIAPVTEHASEASPPHLELCAVVPYTPVPDQTKVNDSVTNSNDSTRCVSISEVEYIEDTVTTNDSSVRQNFLRSEDRTTPEQEGEMSTVGKPLRSSKRLRHKNFVKKKLFPKYFSKSHTHLKTVLNCDTPVKEVSEVAKKDLVKKNVPVPITSISTLNEEDKRALLRNDSLRVHLTGLDHLVIKDHLERYEQMMNKESESVTCTRVEMSEVKETAVGKCVKFSRKQKLKYNSRHYHNGKKLETCTKQEKAILPLEYKKPDLTEDEQIPFNFTIHYRFITVNKNDGYTQVIFKLTQGPNTYLSAEALKELKNTLNSALTDDQCQVLILNSIGESFCSGLDLRPLVGPKKNSASKEIAVAVKEFIEALAAFCKPLVVVVNGEAMGLGVTLLAYCDVIIASDAASFHMPYSHLGFSPEGAATLMLPFVVGSTVAMDMLLRGRRLSAYEACGYGLVTEVLAANRLPFKLVERVRQLAECPSSALENTKSMLRSHLYHRLSLALENETTMLPNQWLSEPCQSALRNAFRSGFLD